jgi:hypothetical protein
MTYTSIGQLYDLKGRVFHTLKQHVLPLSVTQVSFRIAEGQWNVTEILEHLSLVESRLVKLINVFSHKLEKAETWASAEKALIIEIPDGTERNDFMKVRTLEEYEPAGNVSVANSFARLESIHRELLSLRPRLERIDLSATAFDHWLLGSLTLGQWLAFLAIHEQRHLGQIQHILASDSFPKH